MQLSTPQFTSLVLQFSAHRTYTFLLKFASREFFWVFVFVFFGGFFFLSDCKWHWYLNCHFHMMFGSIRKYNYFWMFCCPAALLKTLTSYFLPFFKQNPWNFLCKNVICKYSFLSFIIPFIAFFYLIAEARTSIIMLNRIILYILLIDVLYQIQKIPLCSQFAEFLSCYE